MDLNQRADSDLDEISFSHIFGIPVFLQTFCFSGHREPYLGEYIKSNPQIFHEVGMWVLAFPLTPFSPR